MSHFVHSFAGCLDKIMLTSVSILVFRQLSIHLSIHPSICLSIHLFIYPTIHPSIDPSLLPSSILVYQVYLWANMTGQNCAIGMSWLIKIHAVDNEGGFKVFKIKLFGPDTVLLSIMLCIFMNIEGVLCPFNRIETNSLKCQYNEESTYI